MEHDISEEEADEISPEEAAETAAFDKRLREVEERIRDLEQRGWVWRGDGMDRMLSDPNDPDMHIWTNPYSGEQFLSRKMVERIREQFQAEVAAGRIRVPDR